MTEPHLRTWFQDLPKQTHAAHLGMWVFLASEALLFAGLFTLYGAYRVAYPETFLEAAKHTNLTLGTTMTAVLITSSFTVALALHAARADRRRHAVKLLGATILLAVLFLVLKGIEYTAHFREGIYPGGYYTYAGLSGPGVPIFFTLYYFMTGLHALHVFGGIVLLSVLAFITHRGRLTHTYHTPLELGGMYWHFVDIVWIFLWPLFYLLR